MRKLYNFHFSTLQLYNYNFLFKLFKIKILSHNVSIINNDLKNLI